jgi:hypothetical protein
MIRRATLGGSLLLFLACTQARELSTNAAVGNPAPATSLNQDSPEAVANLRLGAFIRRDYSMIARWTDPGELRRTRLAFDSLIRADSTHYLAGRLFRLDSTAQLQRLSDVDFTAGLLAFQLGVSGSDLYYSRFRGVDIAGVIPRGPDTALVVYRWRNPPELPPMRSYQVEVLVRLPTGWLGQTAGNFQGLIDVFKAPMSRPEQPRR